jgi:hypothetical protein
VVRERAERHWWLKNAGFKLVAGKFIFRSKKIGGSRKLNWWLRNFRPEIYAPLTHKAGLDFGFGVHFEELE